MSKVICDICQQTFKNEDGLAQHKNAKHSAASLEGVSSVKKISYGKIVWIIIALAAVYGIYALVSNTGGSGKYDAFAQCLEEKGAKFYGAFWCSHCSEQKKLFGSSAKYLPYIECSTSNKQGQTSVCINANIQNYPTWEFADSSRTGSLTLSELSQKTGCVLPA